MSNGTPPPRTPPPDDKKKIADAMKKSGAELLAGPAGLFLGEAAQERHRLYILLVMSLVRHFWNGNRNGSTGEYPYRKAQRTGSVYDHGRDYLGHNIAAIAVDPRGEVIDFDFNHNDLFKSSVEHAEARLMRRMFSLTGRATASGVSGTEIQRYSSMLKDFTVYTSLEPCAQCAGIMALARVKDVVYLQVDDGAMRVSNVIYNLQAYSSGARPIQAVECGSPSGEDLAALYDEYRHKVSPAEPFWKHPTDATKNDASSSLTAFLCTDDARAVYEKASGELANLKATDLRYAGWDGDEGDAPADRGARYSNLEVLGVVKGFLDYAKRFDHRGTPH